MAPHGTILQCKRAESAKCGAECAAQARNESKLTHAPAESNWLRSGISCTASLGGHTVHEYGDQQHSKQSTCAIAERDWKKEWKTELQKTCRLDFLLQTRQTLNSCRKVLAALSAEARSTSPSHLRSLPRTGVGRIWANHRTRGPWPQLVVTHHPGATEDTCSSFIAKMCTRDWRLCVAGSTPTAVAAPQRRWAALTRCADRNVVFIRTLLSGLM